MCKVPAAARGERQKEREGHHPSAPPPLQVHDATLAESHGGDGGLGSRGRPGARSEDNLHGTSDVEFVTLYRMSNRIAPASPPPARVPPTRGPCCVARHCARMGVLYLHLSVCCSVLCAVPVCSTLRADWRALGRCYAQFGHPGRSLLSIPGSPPIDAINDSGLTPVLVRMLDPGVENAGLQFNAAWAVTNIASGTSAQCSKVKHVPLLGGLNGLANSLAWCRLPQPLRGPGPAQPHQSLIKPPVLAPERTNRDGAFRLTAFDSLLTTVASHRLTTQVVEVPSPAPPYPHVSAPRGRIR